MELSHTVKIDPKWAGGGEYSLEKLEIVHIQRKSPRPRKRRKIRKLDTVKVQPELNFNPSNSVIDISTSTQEKL